MIESKVKNILNFIEKFLINEHKKHIQTFFTPSLAGDYRIRIYEDKNDKDVCILYAQEYEYIEIYGLTQQEQEQIMGSGYCY